MRDMLAALGGRIGGGMLLLMEEQQPDLAFFHMTVRIFRRWAW